MNFRIGELLLQTPENRRCQHDITDRRKTNDQYFFYPYFHAAIRNKLGMSFNKVQVFMKSFFGKIKSNESNYHNYNTCNDPALYK